MSALGHANPCIPCAGIRQSTGGGERGPPCWCLTHDDEGQVDSQKIPVGPGMMSIIPPKARYLQETWGSVGSRAEGAKHTSQLLLLTGWAYQRGYWEQGMSPHRLPGQLLCYPEHDTGLCWLVQIEWSSCCPFMSSVFLCCGNSITRANFVGKEKSQKS